MNAQHQIKKIMSLSHNEREVALRKLAIKLGCSLASTYNSDGKHFEDELIRRIQEADRSIRDSRLWWIAAISAIASVISALAAWAAIIYATKG